MNSQYPNSNSPINEEELASLTQEYLKKHLLNSKDSLRRNPNISQPYYQQGVFEQPGAIYEEEESKYSSSHLIGSPDQPFNSELSFRQHPSSIPQHQDDETDLMSKISNNLSDLAGHFQYDPHQVQQENQIQIGDQHESHDTMLHGYEYDDDDGEEEEQLDEGDQESNTIYEEEGEGEEDTLNKEGEFSEEQEYEQPTPNNVNEFDFQFDLLPNLYSQFLKMYKPPSASTSPTEIIIDLISLLQNDEELPESIRVGSAIQLLKLAYEEHLPFQRDSQEYELSIDTFVASVIEKLYSYETLDNPSHRNEYIIFVLLELFYFLGPNPVLTQNLPLLISYINRDRFSLVIIDKTLKLLFSMDHLGVLALADYIESQNDHNKIFLLRRLASSPIVIETILVPSLMNQFYSGSIEFQNRALCGISKFGGIASSNPGTSALLESLLKNSSLNKNLVVGTIRSLGDLGKEVLVKQSKRVKNPKILSIICFYLGFEVSNDYIDQDTQIEVVENYCLLDPNFKRGGVCSYQGPIQPPSFATSEGQVRVPNMAGRTTLQEDHPSDDWMNSGRIVIDMEDFLIVLKRLARIQQNGGEDTMSSSQVGSRFMTSKRLIEDFEVISIVFNPEYESNNDIRHFPQKVFKNRLYNELNFHQQVNTKMVKSLVQRLKSSKNS